MYYTMFAPYYKMLDLIRLAYGPASAYPHAFPVIILTIIYTQTVCLEF